MKNKLESIGKTIARGSFCALCAAVAVWFYILSQGPVSGSSQKMWDETIFLLESIGESQAANTAAAFCLFVGVLATISGWGSFNWLKGMIKKWRRK